jgi:hypothetical protein
LLLVPLPSLPRQSLDRVPGRAFELALLQVVEPLSQALEVKRSSRGAWSTLRARPMALISLAPRRSSSIPMPLCLLRVNHCIGLQALRRYRISRSV